MTEGCLIVMNWCNDLVILNCNWTKLIEFAPEIRLKSKQQNYDKTLSRRVSPKYTILHVYTAVNACTEAQQFCNQAPWCCCRASCWDRSDGVTRVIGIMHCRFCTIIAQSCLYVFAYIFLGQLLEIALWWVAYLCAMVFTYFWDLRTKYKALCWMMRWV